MLGSSSVHPATANALLQSDLVLVVDNNCEVAGARLYVTCPCTTNQTCQP